MLRWVLPLGVAVGVALPAALGGQEIPPGYELVWITRDDLSNQMPRMNNRGQIVWDEWEIGVDHSAEIVLYDNGELVRLTSDAVRDAFPDINDEGTVVWTRFCGPDGPYGPTGEIFMRRNGLTVQITDNSLEDRVPRINSQGQIVWYRYQGDSVDRSDIFMYQDGVVTQVTADGLAANASNQGPRINDVGQIVWTRYDFFVNPWESEIRLYDNDQTRTISPPGAFEPQVPDINNLGDVVWFYNTGTTNQAIQLWHAGHVLPLCDGRNAYLNDLGHIYFIRWHEPGGWQGWLYRDCRYYQLTDDPLWSTDGDVNARGEIVWRCGAPAGPYDVRLLRRFRDGDMNCDGSINGFDVEGFVVALSDPDLYGVLYPVCDRTLADVNRDGSVNGYDVDSFVQALLDQE
ncbi:MAG: hypothetical protein CHACPFDD_03580 [Phycisphaerae bacterium]|nr:hypothetical protein [Phycisphaerae bacterium]